MQREVVVALKEDGKVPTDDKRKFKVTFKLANLIDLDTITDFCKGNQQVDSVKEIMVSGTSTSLVPPRMRG